MIGRLLRRHRPPDPVAFARTVIAVDPDHVPVSLAVARARRAQHPSVVNGPDLPARTRRNTRAHRRRYYLDNGAPEKRPLAEITYLPEPDGDAA